MKFHDRTCEWVEKIHPANVVVFDEFYDALGQGYTECQSCMPCDERMMLREGNEIQRVIREEFVYGGCVVCGERRGVQRAHIVPQAMGGVKTIPLCPSCHWNYDHGLLNDKEFENLARVARPDRKDQDIDTLRRFHGAVARLR